MVYVVISFQFGDSGCSFGIMLRFDHDAQNVFSSSPNLDRVFPGAALGTRTSISQPYPEDTHLFLPSRGLWGSSLLRARKRRAPPLCAPMDTVVFLSNVRLRTGLLGMQSLAYHEVHHIPRGGGTLDLHVDDFLVLSNTAFRLLAHFPIKTCGERKKIALDKYNSYCDIRKAYDFRCHATI